jgi:hypothetical protein
MVTPEGFEPPTNWFEASYSIQLSYGAANGVPFCQTERGLSISSRNRRLLHGGGRALFSKGWRNGLQ